MKTVILFLLTAVAEIVGCYLPYLWLRHGKSFWLLIPAIVSLMVFVWLLTLHPDLAGRTYAAYGGVYIGVALLWMWWAENHRPDRWDLLGATLCFLGAAVIVFMPRQS